MLKCPYLLRQIPHNWHNYNKRLQLSEAKNTRKITGIFSKQKSSETLEIEGDEQNESRQSSSDTAINFVEQSESTRRPLTSTSTVESQFTHFAKS